MIDKIVNGLTLGFELVGIGVIVIGTVGATIVFLTRSFRDRDLGNGYDWYRANVGRAILLGLEFLVAADIIGTVAIEPSFRSLGVLGLIVAIRTFLSFALEVEINGRWPWQRRQRHPAADGKDRPLSKDDQ